MTEHQVTLKFGYNIRRYLFFALGFPGGSVVKTLPAVHKTQETWVLLGQEDPLEEEMATHSSTLA